MRKVVLGVGISMDGYIARLDGSVDFLTMDPDYDWDGFMKTVDVWLLGRKTIEAAAKMGWSPESNMGLKTYVFSRTIPPGPAQGFEYTNRDPADLVAELRRSEGKDIWMGGGGELARDFLKQDLIDRIDLGIQPVLIGEGIPLFPPGYAQSSWRLIESRGYPKTGMLTVSYERIPA